MLSAFQRDKAGAYDFRNPVRLHESQESRDLVVTARDLKKQKVFRESTIRSLFDEVLRGFASRLKANVRGIDLACRYGGEEFVVIMPETDVAFAYAVAERLRQNVADVPFPISTSDKALTVTVSIGVTSIERPDDTADTILKRADQALYRAKRDGRNRVVSEAA